MADIRFIYIADVFCPWCYAFGPIMKRIATEHPDIPVHVIGGNLISRPITLAEDYAENPGLVDFWREVEHTTGRSLQGAIYAALHGKEVRMFSPGADEILSVLRCLSPGHELDQLLELEDMFYGNGSDMFAETSLMEIARRWNITVSKFESALDHGAACEATERNLRDAARLMGEITSYPSVLLERNGKIDAVTRGYVHYETVDSRLKNAMIDLGFDIAEHKGCSLQGGCTAGRHK